MKSTYKVLTPRDLDNIISEHREFALDVLIGLSEPNKRLSSKYFYDDSGSRLFQEIMQLEEYYLTRCEYEIFEAHREEIAALLDGTAFNLVELGAGDGLKTSILLEEFIKKGLEFRYVPVDISESAMRSLTDSLLARFPNLTSRGIVAEYFDGVKWLSHLTHRRNVVLFLGSNLGNFSQAQSHVFLRSLWNSLNDGDLLIIGFDIKKEIEVMLKAYNDARGVTARFNLNLLTRINRELGGQFEVDKFQFFATYNVFSGAIESYLVSREPQEVMIEQLGQCFTFEAWEPIHTEYSYKFLESEVQSLAAETGFTVIRQLHDKQHYFLDSIWQVSKESTPQAPAAGDSR